MIKEVYIFIGPPGSGKGTLSRLCVQSFGWKQLSTGDLCRKHIKEQTDIGQAIDLSIKSGKLIPDELMTIMVFDWLKSLGDQAVPAVILDGYPRTIAQAGAFRDAINEQYRSASVFIVKFVASQKSIINRLSGRFICQNQACQAIYSVLLNSDLSPKRSMVCDSCSHALVRRPDDEIESVLERLKIYDQHEQILIDFYKNNKNRVIEFDVEKPVDQVFECFKSLLGLVNSI